MKLIRGFARHGEVGGVDGIEGATEEGESHHLVGQVGNLRPIVNRPFVEFGKLSLGRFPIGRRMPSRPTRWRLTGRDPLAFEYPARGRLRSRSRTRRPRAESR